MLSLPEALCGAIMISGKRDQCEPRHRFDFLCTGQKTDSRIEIARCEKPFSANPNHHKCEAVFLLSPIKSVKIKLLSVEPFHVIF